MSVWRLLKSRAGSGSLGDILSHTMDLSRYLVGEPVEVNGLLKTFIAERPLPDNPAPLLEQLRDRALWPTDVDHVVLADPEGNEFCVVRPKDTLIG